MAVKFEIYRGGQRVRDFKTAGVIVIGPESVAVPGDIAFTDDLLHVDRAEESAVGVALLWDAGAIGAFHLETTRLRARLKPYILNVELARFRLMKIMQKQEDWNLFDFPKAEKYTQMFRDAQSLFADALGKMEEPAEASKLADSALTMAIDLSEQLAMFHAELLINRRRAQGQFVKHIFGCRIDPAVQNEKYRETLANHFDYAVVPLPWKQMQPEEDHYETTAVDAWLEALNRKRLPVITGPLVRLDDASVPAWMALYEEDYDALREKAYEYVVKMVQRYRKAVSIWNVAAGLSANKHFHLSFEQIIELTRMLVSQVKNILPNAKTLITIAQPFGEYHAERPHTVPPMLYAEMVAQAGIGFEAFGLEIEMGVPESGKVSRDLFQLSCMLDKFSTLGRPVFLTAVCAPGRATPDPSDTSAGQLDPERAGRWHRPWDPALQAEWMEAVYRLALSKPYIESVAWSNLADMHQTLPAGGMLDDLLKPKPAFAKLQEMRKTFSGYSVRRGGG